MFDNIAFEVVIGLVFIYLLYSLLVTIIGEIIATKLGFRARMLRLAIERMLNDGYYKRIEEKKNKRLQAWARSDLLYEANEFRRSVAGKFYDYPAIRYLGRMEEDRKILFDSAKPSYISADYFADTLINFLADKGNGATDMERIGFCLRYNTHFVQPKTLQQLRNLYESTSEINGLKANFVGWYNETMDRTTGWYKRRMRVVSLWLGLLLAICFNVDSIRIAKILSIDKDARSQLVSLGVAMANDSTRYQSFVSGSGDTVRSQAVLDSGFARVNHDIRTANQLLGLGWNFSDSVQRADVTLNYSDTSLAIYQVVTDSLRLLLNQKATVANRLQQYVRDKQAYQLSLDSVYADTLLATHSAQIAQLEGNDSLSELYAARMGVDTLEFKRLRHQLEIQNALLRMDSSVLMALNQRQQRLTVQLRPFTGMNNIQEVSPVHGEKYKRLSRIHGNRAYNDSEKVGLLLQHILWFNLPGFLLTALALSLGAPFWFDLLKKLVSIRGTGANPDEKKTAAPGQVVSQRDSDGNKEATPTEDSIDIALRIYSDQIRREPGVINVLKGFYRGTNNQKEPCVQANVKDEITAVEIRNKYGTLRSSTDTVVPLKVVVTGSPQLSSGFDEGQGHKEKGICNKRSPRNIGSFGCLVHRENKPGQVYLLTCYHVLNADAVWTNRNVKDTIIRKGNDQVGRSYEGFLTNLLDTALVPLDNSEEIKFYQSDLGCELPNGVRTVTEDDVFTSQVSIQGFHAKKSSGLIVNHSAPENFEYPIGKKKFNQKLEGLIIISHKEHDFPDFSGVSRGDSGSVVLDENKKAVGIVVGCDLVHTYVININTIFSKLSLQLHT